VRGILSIVSSVVRLCPSGSGMSGFQKRNVGFDVGKYRLPDKHQACVMNSLGANCRICQVLLGVESPGEFGAIKIGNGAAREPTQVGSPRLASILDSNGRTSGVGCSL
jgi:hypothetical protein